MSLAEDVLGSMVVNRFLHLRLDKVFCFAFELLTEPPTRNSSDITPVKAHEAPSYNSPIFAIVCALKNRFFLLCVRTIQ